MLTSTYLFVVGGAVAMSLLHLRRNPRASVGWTAAPCAIWAIIAAWLGGCVGDGMFEAMALLAWGVFAIAPLAFVGVAWLRRANPGWRLGGWAAAIVIWAIGLHAFVVEPSWLEITHVEHQTTAIDRELTIALVADIQTDAPGAYERRVLEAIADAQPDLVLWAGDYLQIDNPEAYARASKDFRALLRESSLDPPLGMFAVQGNNETRASWPELFAGTKVVAVPSTRHIAVAQDVSLTALSLHDGFDPRLRIESAPGLHIVLGHAPDYALGEIDADLLLAGHTHGGQVRLPGLGPIVTLSRVPRAWAAGTTQLEGDRTLVVSRGIGLERGPAPRLRFWCRPELVFIHVRPH
jgi:uncharacterized protein